MTDANTSITIAGRDVQVKRVKVKNAQAVMIAALPFIEGFEDIAKEADKGNFKRTLLFRLVAKHMNDFQTLCTQLTDADRAWLQELEPAEFYQLCEFVITQSGDFFLAQVLEPLEKIGKAAVKLGKQQYNASLVADMINQAS